MSNDVLKTSDFQDCDAIESSLSVPPLLSLAAGEKARAVVVLSLRACNEGLPRPRVARAQEHNNRPRVDFPVYYFPNAFFNNGSISPFAAIGSRTSVSP